MREDMVILFAGRMQHALFEIIAYSSGRWICQQCFLCRQLSSYSREIIIWKRFLKRVFI
jgi:hypothetical protein